MKKTIHIMMLAVTACLASCDAHFDFPDTGMKVGHVLCSDGTVRPADGLGPADRPVAVVFSISHEEEQQGCGLAVYLWNLTPVAMADSIPVSQGTSASLEDADGNANTYALYSTGDTRSPLAEAVFDLWTKGQSAYIPSVAEMRILHESLSAISTVIAGLGGDAIDDGTDGCWYWTSTEVEGQQADKAWLYSMTSGSIQETPKTQPHPARPIITVNR